MQSTQHELACTYIGVSSWQFFQVFLCLRSSDTRRHLNSCQHTGKLDPHVYTWYILHFDRCVLCFYAINHAIGQSVFEDLSQNGNSNKRQTAVLRQIWAKREEQIARSPSQSPFSLDEQLRDLRSWDQTIGKIKWLQGMQLLSQHMYVNIRPKKEPLYLNDWAHNCQQFWKVFVMHHWFEHWRKIKEG